jgi:pyridinium-3,5-bisthiocarboxylic acid mononucleotide nickel chelatase
VPCDWLVEQLNQLPLDQFNIETNSVTKNGIAAVDVHVKTYDEHTHRHFAVIKQLIQNSPFSDWVKNQSLNIFERIAQAESHIHNCDIEKVHFHEVGGMDAIIDVIGSILSLEYLGIQKVHGSVIPLGKGFVNCQHGVLPVPAPATLEILKDTPVRGTEVEHEMVTPTGAAIITALAGQFGTMPEMTIGSIGYGAGKSDFGDIPNLLRIVIGELPNRVNDNNRWINENDLIMIETCIDDMNPEFYGYLMERLFEKGALDVYWVPIYMKKNRPGSMIQIVCRIETQDEMIQQVLSETTSTGVRISAARRVILAREMIQITTPFGTLKAKQITKPDGTVYIAPEYDECRRVALEQNIPLQEVYDSIARSSNKD